MKAQSNFDENKVLEANSQNECSKQNISTIIYDNINSSIANILQNNPEDQSLTDILTDNGISNEVNNQFNNLLLDGQNFDFSQETSYLKQNDQTNTEEFNCYSNRKSIKLNNNDINLENPYFNTPNEKQSNNQHRNINYLHSNQLDNKNLSNSSSNNNINNGNYNYNSGNSSSQNNIIFVFEKEKMRYDINTVIMACPVLINYIEHIKNSRNNIIINMPDWISQSDLLEYFFFFKNSSTHNFSIQAKKILHIADFFENEVLIRNLIENHLIPYLNTENALILLEDSFQKLSDSSESQIDKIWYDLFIASIDCVAKNFLYYVSNEPNKMKYLNKKILEEIIDKFLGNLLLNTGSNLKNNKYSEHDQSYLSAEQFQLILDYIFILRNYNTGNIFDLLSNEYLRIASEENISELITTQKATFQLNLNKELKYFYQEFNIPLNKFIFITFIVYYKKSDDSMNVSYKVNNNESTSTNISLKPNNNFPILTLLSVTNFLQDTEKKQITVKSAASTKTLLNIFRIDQFKQNYIKNLNCKSLCLSVHLKICYIHSTICNFILRNFDRFYNEPSIHKISKQLLALLILQYKIIVPPNTPNDEDILVVSLMAWLNDEINLQEESFKDLFELIDWNKVSVDVFCEFLLKFYKIIEQSELEDYFNEIFEMKIKNGFLCDQTINNKFQNHNNLNDMNINNANFSNNQSNINIVSNIQKTNTLLSRKEKNSNNLDDKNLVNEKLINYFSKIFMKLSKKLDHTKILTENFKFAKFSNLKNSTHEPLSFSKVLIDKELDASSIERSKLLNFFSDDDEFDVIKKNNVDVEIRGNNPYDNITNLNINSNTGIITNQFIHVNNPQEIHSIINRITNQKLFNFQMNNVDEKDTQNEVIKTLNTVNSDIAGIKNSRLDRSRIQIVSPKEHINKNLGNGNNNHHHHHNNKIFESNTIDTNIQNNFYDPQIQKLNKQFDDNKTIDENYHLNGQTQRGQSFKGFQVSNNNNYSNNFYLKKNKYKENPTNLGDSISDSENLSSRHILKIGSEKKLKSDTFRRTEANFKNKSSTQKIIKNNRNREKSREENLNNNKKFDFYEYSSYKTNNINANLNSLNSISMSTNHNKYSLNTHKNTKYSIEESLPKKLLVTPNSKQNITNSIVDSTKSKLSDASIQQKNSQSTLTIDKEKEIDNKKYISKDVATKISYQKDLLISQKSNFNFNNTNLTRNNQNSQKIIQNSTTSKGKIIQSSNTFQKLQKSVDLNFEKFAIQKSFFNVKKEDTKPTSSSSVPSNLLSKTGGKFKK